MRNWCLRHPIQFMALYFVFYLAFFSWLEARTTAVDWVVWCPLDALIPFCKYAIVPYCLWYLWVPNSLLQLLRKAPREEFWRTVLPLFFGYTFSLFFYAVVTSKLYLRPFAVHGQDIFAIAVRFLYKMDPSVNVCPSMHVFASMTMNLAWQRSSLTAGATGRSQRLQSHLLCFAIVMSTVLLRQHSVIDVILGFLLAVVMDQMAARYLQGGSFEVTEAPAKKKQLHHAR